MNEFSRLNSFSGSDGCGSSESSEFYSATVLEQDASIAMYAAACALLNPADYPSLAVLAASATALLTIVRSASAAEYIDAVINDYALTVYNTVNDSAEFAKKTVMFKRADASNGTQCKGSTETGDTIVFIKSITDTASGANTFIIKSSASGNELINTKITQTTVNYNPHKVALRGMDYDFGTYYPNENQVTIIVATAV